MANISPKVQTMRVDVKSEVQGKWPGIFEHEGINVGNGREHVECPICGKKKFRMDDKQGRGEWICVCGSGDGWKLWQMVNGVDFLGAIKMVSPLLGIVEKIERKDEPKITVEQLRKIFKTTKPASHQNTVGIYLKGRGLAACPECLRFNPSCWDGETHRYYPAMMAMVHSPAGKMLTFHRTFLSAIGGKADMECPKKLMPAVEPIQGAAIRLYPPEHGVIGVAEGIETALACYELHGIPTWSAVNAAGMQSFQLPEGIPIKKLWIYGDNDSDKSYAGQAAAYALAKRMAEVQHVPVEVMIPDGPGDWLDVLNFRRG